jgi:hypothetical protein
MQGEDEIITSETSWHTGTYLLNIQLQLEFGNVSSH